MASISKDRRFPKYWYAHFTDAFGRRRKKSTGETSPSKAKEIAQTLQRAANEARRGALTEARTRDLLSEILQSVNGEGLRMFTVTQWLEHFVAQKQKSRSDKTALRHEQMTREFLEFLGPRARLNIAAITSKDIAGFRDQRHSLGLAPSTVNLDITILSAAFNSAWKQGHISVNPCAVIEPLKEKSKRKDTFTPEQVTALLNALDTMEFAAHRGGKLDKASVRALRRDWRGLILCAFYVGARLSDCANLRWRNVDLVSEIKTVRFEQGKTGREIVTVIHPALEDHLLTLPTAKSDDDFIFPTLAGRKISPLSKAFQKIMEHAHIKQRVIRKRSEDGSGRSVNALTFHSLRHSFTSLLANAGVSQELRMTLTGHTQADIHKIYTHHELQALQAAVAMLPRV
jgi:integrase